MPVAKSHAANARHLSAESGNLHHKILPTPANTLHRERKAFLVLLLAGEIFYLFMLTRDTKPNYDWTN